MTKKPGLRSGGQALAPEAGWVGSAYFGKGGTQARKGSGLAVHSVNPELETDLTTPARLRLLNRAISTAPPGRSATVYLTAAGFFQCDIGEGISTGAGVGGGAEVPKLERALRKLAKQHSEEVLFVVGVDIGDQAQRQELWWISGCSGVIHRTGRSDIPAVHHFAGYALRGYVCGAIIGQSGHRLDPQRDLKGTDVVLDAGHVRLNRMWDPTPGPQAKRHAFHQMINSIGGYAGAVFSHAHGPDFSTYVRDCDNWIVYRGSAPFPGEQAGQPAEARSRAGVRI